MKQNVLDFVAKVAPGKATDLDAVLTQIGNDIPGNGIVPFAKLSLVHFSNMVVFDSTDFGSYLVWEHNFDADLETYLDELLKNASGIDRILSCCEGYSAAKRRDYLRSHLVRPSVYHIGTVGRSVSRILREADLRDRIESFLDRQAVSNLPPEAVRAEIRKFVAADPSLAWVKEAEPRMTTAERVLPYVHIALLILLALGVIVALAVWKWWLIPVFAIGLLLLLRWHELRDQPSNVVPPAGHIRGLLLRENTSAQNLLPSVTVVKPGIFRKLTLRFVLFSANLVARISTKGQLAGIPTIHFAHWSLIDGGRRLLFMSNYEGSWGSYLDDFIDKVSFGLTGIWSNTVGFPKSEFLILKGSRDGPRFKNFARDSQALMRVRYCAYPNLTVRNINENSTLREGLYGSMDAREWLRLL